MFNQHGFNALPFNRPEESDVQLSFEMDLTQEFASILNLQGGLAFELDHSHEFASIMNTDTFLSFEDELKHEFNSIMTRDRIVSFEDVLKLEKEFNMARFHVQTLVFKGNFAQGDKIIIDSDRLKFTKNGDNALHEMTGDFINLYVGENRMMWSDDQQSREVLMRLQYRDRYL